MTKMDEKQEEQKTESTSDGQRLLDETSDPIERAVQARQRLEEENNRLERNIKELQKIQTREILGGGSAAGSGAVEEKKKVDPEAFGEALLSGRVIKSE